MSLFNDTFTTLEKALNYSSAKNRVISNNIANVVTPEYKTKGVAFKDVLADKRSAFTAKRTHERHYDFRP